MQRLVLVGFTALALVGFQNCSNVGFGHSPKPMGDVTTSSVTETTPSSSAVVNPVTEPNPSYPYTPPVSGLKKSWCAATKSSGGYLVSPDGQAYSQDDCHSKCTTAVAVNGRQAGVEYYCNFGAYYIDMIMNPKPEIYCSSFSANYAEKRGCAWKI